jgi:hypothetical protein
MHLNSCKLADVCRKAGQALLAAPSDSDKESMAILNDPPDATHVSHCIFEQHQVHVGIHFVVSPKSTLENRTETVEALNSIVVRIVDAFREMTEDQRFWEQQPWLDFFEVLPPDLLCVLDVECQILIVHQSVSIHTLGLMRPQRTHQSRRFDDLRHGHQQPLENIRQVPNVELVVKVDRRFAERCDNFAVQLECGLSSQRHGDM